MTAPTTPRRCEPPDTTKGGWHWVQLGAAKPVPKHWHGYHQGWEGIGVPYADGDVSAAIGYRYHSPVTPPAEVEALRAEVMRAGAECGDMGGEIARLRAEVSSLRVSLGQQEPTYGVEPIGCPLPGMCSMVAATATLRARVAELEAAAREFVAWATSNGFTDPENMLVCAEWHNLRAALEGKP